LFGAVFGISLSAMFDIIIIISNNASRYIIITDYFENKFINLFDMFQMLKESQNFVYYTSKI